MFDEIKKTLPCWGLQITPEKIQRGHSINYLGYKSKKVRPQKVQIRRDQLRALNNFHKVLGDIYLLAAVYNWFGYSRAK